MCRGGSCCQVNQVVPDGDLLELELQKGLLMVDSRRAVDLEKSGLFDRNFSDGLFE